MAKEGEPMDKKSEQLLRKLKFIAEAKKNNYPNAGSFAKKMQQFESENGQPFGCSARTIARDIRDLIEFHKAHGKIATITAVQPGGRFGMLEIGDDHQIMSFKEKSKDDGGWVNGGFMVLEPEVMDYIKGDDSIFERQPMEKLTAEHQLMAYRHEGFWQCMDNPREYQLLNELWQKGQAPWTKYW